MKRIILWYIGGCVVWTLLFGMLAATPDLLLQIGANFAALSVGIFIGFLLTTEFVRNRPWVAALVPVLYIPVGIFVEPIAGLAILAGFAALGTGAVRGSIRWFRRRDTGDTS
jgi:hypothetical protein